MSNAINASRRPTNAAVTGPAACCPITLAAPYLADAFAQAHFATLPHPPAPTSHHQQNRQQLGLNQVSQNHISMSRQPATIGTVPPITNPLTTSSVQVNLPAAHQQQTTILGNNSSNTNRSNNLDRHVNVMQSDQLVQQQAHRQQQMSQPQTAPQQNQPLFMAQAPNQVPTGPNYSNYIANLHVPSQRPPSYVPNAANIIAHHQQQQHQITTQQPQLEPNSHPAASIQAANCASNLNTTNTNSNQSDSIQSNSRRPTSMPIPNLNQTASQQQIPANYHQQQQQNQPRNIYQNEISQMSPLDIQYNALLLNQMFSCLPLIPEMSTFTAAIGATRHLPQPQQLNTHPVQNRTVQQTQAPQAQIDSYQGRQPIQQQHTSSVSHQSNTVQTQQQQQQENSALSQNAQPPTQQHQISSFYPLAPAGQAAQFGATNPAELPLAILNIFYNSFLRNDFINRHSHHPHHPAHHHHHHLHASHHHHHHHHHGLNGQNGSQDDTMINISESKPKGLNKGEIEQLATYIQTNEKDSRSCVICLCKFELKSRIRSLPCSHVFHAKCVDKWLRLNRTCPICRRDALKTHEAKTKRI